MIEIDPNAIPTYNVVSLDIETTGLDPQRCQLLSIGIVLDNLAVGVSRSQLENYFHTLPKLHFYVKRDEYRGNAYALSLNSKILEILSKAKDNFATQEVQLEGESKTVRVINSELVISEIATFLKKNNVQQNKWGQRTLAGKNVLGFDVPFLKQLEDGNLVESIFSHKAIDPGPLYYNPSIDVDPPSLGECLKRAGYDKPVAHDAIEDALDVLRVLRHKYHHS